MPHRLAVPPSPKGEGFPRGGDGGRGDNPQSAAEPLTAPLPKEPFSACGRDAPLSQPSADSSPTRGGAEVDACQMG